MMGGKGLFGKSTGDWRGEAERGMSQAPAGEGLGFRIGHGAIPPFGHLDLSGGEAQLAFAAALPIRNQLRYGPAVPHDNDLFPGRGLPQQPGQVGLRLVYVVVAHANRSFPVYSPWRLGKQGRRQFEMDFGLC